MSKGRKPNLFCVTGKFIQTSNKFIMQVDYEWILSFFSATTTFSKALYICCAVEGKLTRAETCCNRVLFWVEL